jgi:PAS domain S-box-containing protein
MTIDTSIPEYAEKLAEDHPVRIYLEENLFLKKLISEINSIDFIKECQLAYNLFNQIATVEIRYVRKENQLFPYLEKRGWFGPSQGMWRFQDENRKLIKNVRTKIENAQFQNLKADLDLMTSELMRMVQVEELRLLPIALEILLPEDWESMKHGEYEIGWMHKKIENNQLPELDNTESSIVDGFLKMNEGLMTLQQINLLFQVMPFDLTYVDENDKVIFYNRGEERVFPRSAGVIGREVRFCHPPKSVSTVLKILEEFRAGTKSVAEFWINFRGKVVHIRYFAVRDKDNKYKGVIEVSQDITEIKKIEGEKRLLDWEE